MGVIPVKPLAKALGRLSPALDRRSRRVLQAAMLVDVLSACRRAEGLSEVMVVTSDPEARAIAHAGGARVVADHVPARGMNAAVTRGVQEALRGGAEAALVLTADLPLVQPDDIDATIAACPSSGRSVTLVPSRDGTGTNAMLIRPPGSLAPCLGPESLARHLRQAHEIGIGVSRIERSGIALDVDTPGDLAAALESGVSCTTRAVAEERGIREGLSASAL